MKLHISDWKGKFPVEVIPLDKYDLFLGLEFFDSANAMINMKTKSILITDPKCASVFGLMETKSISMIKLVDEELRVEELVAESRAKPQLLEEPKVELGQPTPTQCEMLIHVLFPEAENLPSNMKMAELKKELLVE